jgi:DNA-binding MarR family transcriptional regulator
MNDAPQGDDKPEPGLRLVAALDRALTQLAAVIETVYVERPLAGVLGDAEEITAAQLRTLGQLSSVDHLTVGSIAAGLKISYPAASKAVDRLVERELASRARDASDARTTRVQLTARGREVLNRLAAERREKLRGVLAHLGGEKPAQALLMLLEAFIAESLGGIQP